MATPIIQADYANTVAYRDLVRIGPNASGLLKGIALSSGDLHHWFKITIDGQTLVDEYFCGCLGNYENNGMALDLPFNDELAVQIRDDPQPTAIPRFWVAYTRSSSKLEKEYVTTEIVEDREFVYKYKEFATDRGPFTEKLSLGCERISELRLHVDTYFRDEEIKGVIKLRDWQSKPLPPESNVPVILRAIGRSF